MLIAFKNFNFSVTVSYNYREENSRFKSSVAMHSSVNIPWKFILFYRRNGYFVAEGSVRQEEKQLQLKDISRRSAAAALFASFHSPYRKSSGDWGRLGLSAERSSKPLLDMPVRDKTRGKVCTQSGRGDLTFSLAFARYSIGCHNDNDELIVRRREWQRRRWANESGLNAILSL